MRILRTLARGVELTYVVTEYSPDYFTVREVARRYDEIVPVGPVAQGVPRPRAEGQP